LSPRKIERVIYGKALRKKPGATEHSKGTKTVPGKMATTRTEDRHK